MQAQYATVCQASLVLCCLDGEEVVGSNVLTSSDSVLGNGKPIMRYLLYLPDRFLPAGRALRARPAGSKIALRLCVCVCVCVFVCKYHVH